MKEPRLLNIPVTDIDDSDRYRKNYKDLEGLMMSIKEQGLIHPIAIEHTPGSTFEYKLLAGGRRYRAVCELGYATISSRIFEEGLDNYDRRIIELTENLVREDLTYSEEVAITKKVHELQEEKLGPASRTGGGASHDKTANMLNRSRSTVQSDIELAEAIEELPELAECKNKSEALKKYKKLKESIYKSELSERFSKKINKDNVDDSRKKVVNSYVVKDFFKGAKQLDSGMFNCVEIDPPYGIDLKKTKKSSTTDGYTDVDQNEYYDFLSKVCKESYRLITSSGGWVILWFGQDPWSAIKTDVLNGVGTPITLYDNTIYRILAETGFTKISRIPAIWAKEKHTGQTRWPEYRLGSSYEPFLYARKGDAVIYNPGRNNIYSSAPVPVDRKVHPTERPIEMIQEVLRTFSPPGGSVLVPFAGSGNTLLAAYNMAMTAVGFDLSQEYKDSFVQKVSTGQIGKYNSLY